MMQTMNFRNLDNLASLLTMDREEVERMCVLNDIKENGVEIETIGGLFEFLNLLPKSMNQDNPLDRTISYIRKNVFDSQDVSDDMFKYTVKQFKGDVHEVFDPLDVHKQLEIKFKVPGDSKTHVIGVTQLYFNELLARNEYLYLPKGYTTPYRLRLVALEYIARRHEYSRSYPLQLALDGKHA